MKRLCAVLMLTGALVGCDNEPSRDVKYYTEHPDERAAKLEECKNNPGEAKYSPNCDNAKASASRAILDSNNTGMSGIK
ncbi:EexN family lipoprotein [Salmonella enterica]